MGVREGGCNPLPNVIQNDIGTSHCNLGPQMLESEYICSLERPNHMYFNIYLPYCLNRNAPLNVMTHGCSMINQRYIWWNPYVRTFLIRMRMYA